MLKRLGIVLVYILAIAGITCGYIFASIVLAKLLIHFTAWEDSIAGSAFMFGFLGVPIIVGAIILAPIFGIIKLIYWIITGNDVMDVETKSLPDKDYTRALKELEEEFPGAQRSDK